MTLVPDDALVSPRYTTNKVAEVKALPPKEDRVGLSKFKVPVKAKVQLQSTDGGGLWGLLNPKSFS